ncbi:hypothetical protein [Nocardia sp. NPDC005978]|uniref:hypothetical protein n=1 Tax=unclassified Nocardia TaxID=2637762 RepID=UPI0033A7A12D
MGYRFELPHFSSEANLAEQTLRGMDSVSAVSTDAASETLDVTSSLSYGEVLDVLRQQGISAK